jgi:hypothetical protein
MFLERDGGDGRAPPWKGALDQELMGDLLLDKARSR